MKELATFAEPESFLRVVRRDLEIREAENSLMLGVLLNMDSAPPLGSAPTLFASVQDHGAWSVAAILTPPYPLVLATASPELPDEELALLARYLRDDGIAVSGVEATPNLAKAFATRWTEVSGRRTRGAIHQRIYSLTAVDEPTSLPGTLRRAAPADLELVSRWFAEFLSEALNENDPDRARQLAERRIQRREVYLWEDSEPRSRPPGVVRRETPSA